MNWKLICVKCALINYPNAAKGGMFHDGQLRSGKQPSESPEDVNVFVGYPWHSRNRNVECVKRQCADCECEIAMAAKTVPIVERKES